MADWIGIGRRARRCYGFDEVALVPGDVTINPNEVDTSWSIDGKKFKVPILAAAMDGVVDVDYAVKMGKLGGIAVLNLDGVQTRYDNPKKVLNEIASATPEEATKLVQSVYCKPVKESLIAKRKTEHSRTNGCSEGVEVHQKRAIGLKAKFEIVHRFRIFHKGFSNGI